MSQPFGIILPDKVFEFECLCGKQFFSKKVGQRHSARCDKAMEMIQRHAEGQKQSVFTHEPDEEVSEWKSKRRGQGKPVTDGRGNLA